MKKIIGLLILFALFFLSSCEENSSISVAYIAYKDTQTGKFVLNGTTIQKFRNLNDGGNFINTLGTVLNNNDKLFGDGMKDFLADGNSINDYKKELDKHKKNVEYLCDNYQKGELNKQEREVISKECSITKEEIEKRIDNIKDLSNKCSVSSKSIEQNIFFKDLILLLNKGRNNNESFYKSYRYIKNKYVNDTIKNIEDPIIQQITFKCFNDNFSNFYEYLKYDLINGGLINNQIINLEEIKKIRSTFFKVIILSKKYKIYKKKFQSSFIRKYEKEGAPLYKLARKNKCGKKCQSDFKKDVIDKFVIPDIRSFLSTKDFNSIEFLKNSTTCYNGSDCYLYFSSNNNFENEEYDIDFVTNGKKGHGKKGYIKKIDIKNHLYELRISEKDFKDLIFGKQENIYLGIGLIGSQPILSNSINIYIKNLSNENNFNIANKVESGLKIPFWKAGNSKVGAEASVSVGGYGLTEAGINFEGEKPNKFEFGKIFGLKGGAGIEGKISSGYASASAGANVEGIFESKRKYSYNYGTGSVFLFLNTFNNDLGYDIKSIGSTYNKNNYNKYSNFLDNLSIETKRQFNLNYFHFDDSVTLNEGIHHAISTNPNILIPQCIAGLSGKGKNNCVLCTSTLFTNFSKLDELGCGVKGSIGAEAKGEIDAVIVSGNVGGNVKGSIANYKIYDKTGNKLKKVITSHSWETGIESGFNNKLDFIGKLKQAFWDSLEGKKEQLTIEDLILPNYNIVKNNFLSETTIIRDDLGKKIKNIEQVYISDINQDIKDFSLKNEYNLKVKYSNFKNIDLIKKFNDDFEKNIDFNFNNTKTINNISNFGNELCSLNSTGSYDIDFSILLKNNEYNNKISLEDYTNILGDSESSEGELKNIKINFGEENFKNNILAEFKKDYKVNGKKGISIFELLKSCNNSNNLGVDKKRCKQLNEKFDKVFLNILKKQKWFKKVFTFFEKGFDKTYKTSNIKDWVKRAKLEKTKEYELELPIASFNCKDGILNKKFIKNNIDLKESTKNIENRKKVLKKAINDSLSDAQNNIKNIYNNFCKLNKFDKICKEIIN